MIKWAKGFIDGVVLTTSICAIGFVAFYSQLLNSISTSKAPRYRETYYSCHRERGENEE